MHETLLRIFEHLRAMWRWRWYGLAVAWVLALAGWGVTLKLPDVYRASAKVHVDTQSVLRPLLRGLAVDLNSQGQIALMTRTLLSRPNVEKVARMTDLDLRAQDRVEMDHLVDDLTRRLRVTAAGRENLYTISFDDPNPELAKDVVQSVLTIFVENTLGETRQDTDTAQRFLDRQIAEYEARLIAAETRLKEFKRENVGLMPGQGGDHFARMQQARTDLEAIQLEVRQAENRRDAVALQLEDAADQQDALYALVPEVSSDEPVSLPIDARIGALESQLDELLIRFTEQHPDVISTERTLRQLRQQRAGEAARIRAARAAAASNAAMPAGENPLQQQLTLALAQEEASLAALRVRSEEYQRRLEAMQELVNTVPAIEAEMANLNRDYDVTRRNYQQLLERREQARISQQAGQTSDDVRFRIIEPPRVPNEPSGPNRPLLLSAALAVACVAGVALTLLIAQLYPTFSNRRSLGEVTMLPVLGAVGLVEDPRSLRRGRLALLAFGGLTFGLLLVFGALQVMQVIGLARLLEAVA